MAHVISSLSRMEPSSSQQALKKTQGSSSMTRKRSLLTRAGNRSRPCNIGLGDTRFDLNNDVQELEAKAAEASNLEPQKKSSGIYGGYDIILHGREAT